MIAYIDTETTGLSSEHCSLLEIAAIACGEDGEVVTTFHEYINPGSPIPAKIVELTRITNEKVKFARKEKDVLSDFIEWIVGNNIDTFVIHNASFDMRFLRDRSKKRYVANDIFNRINVIDSMVLAKKLVAQGKIATSKTATGRSSVKQEAIAKALGVEYGDGGAHSAIEDVMVLRKIHSIMEEMNSDN